MKKKKKTTHRAFVAKKPYICNGLWLFALVRRHSSVSLLKNPAKILIGDESNKCPILCMNFLGSILPIGQYQTWDVVLLCPSIEVTILGGIARGSIPAATFRTWT